MKAMVIVTALAATWGVWALYAAGMLLHVFMKAQIAYRSKLNGLSSFWEYLRAQLFPILCRVFLNTMAFMVLWDNPDVIDLSNLNLGINTKLGLAGTFGWFSDSVFDKLLGYLSRVFPGLQKEVPPSELPPHAGGTGRG